MEFLDAHSIPLDSLDARLLKRSWESLRRTPEYRNDCQWVLQSASKKTRKQREAIFSHKWGIWNFDCTQSFADLTHRMTSLDVEDSGPFGLLHDRLRWNFEVAPDPHVNCEELEQVFQVITHFAPSLFPSLGMKRPKRKLGFAWARTSLCPREITLKVNLEANPIVVLGKILTIMEKMRGCRAASHEVKPYSSRIQQRIHTLEKMLNGYVDVGHFDDANDEDAFKVWDRVTQRVRRDDIAREVWPKDYKKDLSYPGGPLMQRIRDYKDRVDGWIEEYSSLIRQTTIAIPPKK